MPIFVSRREVVVGFGAALALTGLPAALTSPAAASAQTGVPAPDFTAADSKNKQHTLAGYRGKTVVLEWTNHECPYTVKHYATGNMQALQQSATDAGVIWLAVVSSRPGTQGYVEGLDADRLTEERNARPTAVLLDPKGGLGRLYGASTTPHMYVINRAGVLVYMGGIDDQPSANHATVKTARNYVREALDALAARKPIAVASARPYGCSVKY
jgi:peroxiredoxin